MINIRKSDKLLMTLLVHSLLLSQTLCTYAICVQYVHERFTKYTLKLTKHELKPFMDTLISQANLLNKINKFSLF